MHTATSNTLLTLGIKPCCTQSRTRRNVTTIVHKATSNTLLTLVMKPCCAQSKTRNKCDLHHAHSHLKHPAHARHEAVLCAVQIKKEM